MTPNLQEQLQTAPDRPGCYIFKDLKGAVLYVGKAESLRSRTRSYFQESVTHHPRTQAMVKQVASLDVMVTDNTVEALLLESNLIKRHRPRYNVRLRDDKHYPYICLTTSELYPRPIVVRRARKDGNRYFGPYTNSGSMRQALKALHQIFRLRSCSRRIEPGDQQRPCLDLHIGLCTAPCASLVSPEEYGAQVREVIEFLEGRPDRAIAALQSQMEDAAGKMRFEAAARYRDQIRAIENIMERQKVLSTRLDDQDVFAIVSDEIQAFACVLRLRAGRLIGQEFLRLEGVHPDEMPDATRQVVQQFYADRPEGLPRKVLLPHDFPDRPLIEEWLTRQRKLRVEVSAPQRGQRCRLVQLARENAAEQLQAARTQAAADDERTELALLELQRELQLDRIPHRIECYDISNLQGNQTVGAMTVLLSGQAARSQYRRFKVRNVDGPNDYASLQDVLGRRLRNLIAGAEKWTDPPDLLVIDGGKGQLSAALELQAELGVSLPTIGLAKRLEEVFLPGRSEPLILSRRSQALFMLQRVRDEAHRFGVTYHRQLRGRAQTRSRLDSVPGIGDKRRKALLKRFGSLDKMRQASLDELAAVPGMNRRAAEEVSRALSQSGQAG